MLCLLGLGTSGMAQATGLDPISLLATAGVLASRHRTEVGLAGLIAAQFPGHDVRIEPCVERRAAVPPDQRMKLGRSGSGLGQDAYLGESVHDRSGRFRIVIGPLTEAQFRALLPGQPELLRLARLVRLYLADPLEFELVLVLRAEEVPAFRLRPRAELPLGAMSWIQPRGDRPGRAPVAARRADPLANQGEARWTSTSRA